MFTYGAQYYRPPNPPADEWESDLEQMSDCGFNTVKLWAMWNHTHVAESEYDFSELEELVDHADSYDLQVVISLILENAPHWLAQEHPEARYEDQDGHKMDLRARPNTPGGGWPGLCLNHTPVREHATNYMEELGKKFAGDDTVAHYTTWDEAFFESNGRYPNKRFCHCDRCALSFRKWLRERYETLGDLNEAWEQRLTDWQQVQPPQYHGGYPRYLDWLRFRLDNHQELMQWRADVLSKADSTTTIRAHGIAGNLGGLVDMFNDDWESATTVEEWGTTTFPHWGPDHPNITTDFLDQTADHHLMLDLARGAAQGRQFWQTELQGGHVRSGTASAPQGLTRGPDPTPDEMTLWNWHALMGGVNGILYWQYRPELLGQESPGFGLVRRDGAPTERTEVAERFATLVNDSPELEKASPIRGDLALGLLPEGALFNYVAEKDTDQFAASARGAYRALWEAGYQVDCAKPRQFKDYDAIYLPFPLLLESDTASTIKKYVQNGGTLITDGTPAVYDDNGRVFQTAPGKGLRDVFGAELRSTRAATDEKLELPAGAITARSRRDVFDCNTATPLGYWDEDDIGAIQNAYGDGTAIGLGTLVGSAHAHGEDVSGVLRSMLHDHGIRPTVQSTRHDVRARLHKHPDGTLLYVTNLSESQKTTVIHVEQTLGDVSHLIGSDVRVLDRDPVTLEIDAQSGGAIFFGEDPL